MIIEVRQGDIFKALEAGEFNVLAHGANCLNTMGAGIARLVSMKCPAMYEADRLASRYGTNTPGWFSCANIGEEILGVNLYTQLMPGPNARLSYIRYSVGALVDFLGSVDGEEALKDKPPVIGIPKIGCGIGGLVWEDVKEVIEEASGGIPVIVYEL